FSRVYSRRYWRHLKAGLPHYDVYFAYRKSNLVSYREHGCPEVELLRSCYIREIHRPLPDVRDSPHACDVAFVGHWEPDGRDLYLKALLEAPALRLRIHGCDSWKRSGIRPQLAARGVVGAPRLGHDYNLVLNSAKIALVFLSRK